MNGISKWLKDKQGNVLIPNTLTKTVFNDDGKNLDELLSSNLQLANSANSVANTANQTANNASNKATMASNAVDNMLQIINQASNTWIISDYMKEAIHYNCGVGLPEDNGYSADDYNDENGWDEPYLDVLTGIVYRGTRIKDLPLTYGWVEKERLTNVQDALTITGTIEGAITTKNVLSTLEECTASTTSTDVAGASALAELNDSLSLVGENVFYTNFSNKRIYSTYRACINIPHINQYNVELVSVKISGGDTGSGEWESIYDSTLTLTNNSIVVSTGVGKSAGSPCVISVNITPKA